MAKSKANTRPIRINFRSVQQVLVEPDDQDRFLITAREAAHACKQAQSEKDWLEEFKRFLAHIRGWCENHAEQVETALVDIGDGGLNILVCTLGRGYNVDLDDALTDLDLELAEKFPWCVADVMQVSAGAKEGHVSLERAVLVYGDGKRT